MLNLKQCWLTSAALLFIYSCPNAQELIGISAKWDDSFSEWYVFANVEDTELEGELNIKWASRDDWSSWDYYLGSERGEIRLKWRDNPNLWEIRGGGQLIVARTVWKDDFSQWRIESENLRLTFQSKWRNLANEWEVREDKNGFFLIYTDYEGDPRDWIIEDGLDKEISLHFKIALLFLTIFHSSPKM